MTPNDDDIDQPPLFISKNETLDVEPTFTLPFNDSESSPSSSPSSQSSSESSESNSNDESTIYGPSIDYDEGHLSYNALLDHLNKVNPDSDNSLWKFDSFIDHRLHNNRAEVLVNWHHGHPTWVPVSDMKKLDLLATLQYAKAHRLGNKHGWKWSKLLSTASAKKIKRPYQSF